MQDRTLHTFITQLGVSATSHGIGNLRSHIPEGLKFKMPRWLARGVDEPGSPLQSIADEEFEVKDVKVLYLFDHFELDQTIDFVPKEALLAEEAEQLHPAAADLLKKMPKQAYIRYREVDEGVLRGKRTEISLRLDREESLPQDAGAAESSPEVEAPATTGSNASTRNADIPSRELLASALQVAELVTKAVRGEVRVYTPGSERKGRDEGEAVEALANMWR